MGVQPIFYLYGEDMDLQPLLEATLGGLGYELVDLEISNRGKLLRVFIDKPGGVGIDDCVLVTSQLTRVFEVDNIDYDRLEVSSPGLDRPLKKEADFMRFVGEMAHIKLRLPHEGQRKYTGILRGVKDGILQLEVDGTLLALDLSNLDKARLVPRF